MSIDALRSALAMERCEGLGPKHKAVLIVLGDHANAAGEAFVSRAAIEAETWFERKAVSSALADLKAAGLIVDTGRRRGRTGQVVVWSLPWIDHRHQQARKRAAFEGEDYAAEADHPQSQQRQGLRGVSATAEQARKGNSSENGPLSERGPKRDSKRPENGRKEARKGATEPPTGFNPSTEAVTPLPGEGVARAPAAVGRPDWISPQVWADWISHRSKPLTRSAWAAIEAELRKGIAAGHSADAMLAEADVAEWKGFRFAWYLRRLEEQGKSEATDAGAQLWDGLVEAIRRGPDGRQEFIAQHPECREAVRKLGGFSALTSCTERDLRFKRPEFIAALGSPDGGRACA